MAHQTRIDKLRAIMAEQASPARSDASTQPPRSAPRPVGIDLGRLDHYQAAMDADLGRLKELKTVAEKVAAKREMLATYWPFVEGYLNDGDNYPNSIAVEIMLWLIDIGDIERGLNLAYVLIDQNQHTPPRISSDIPTFLCDNLYDWASKQLDAGRTVSPALDTFCATLHKKRWDVHPVPAGKVFAMLAKHKFKDGDYQACIDACTIAENYNDRAGVKKLKKDACALLTPSGT